MVTAEADALATPERPAGTVDRAARGAEAGLAALGALFGLSQFDSKTRQC